MKTVNADVVVVGSGAGGGTVAQELAPLVAAGKRVLVLERGPRFRDEEFNGQELEMADGALPGWGWFPHRGRSHDPGRGPGVRWLDGDVHGDLPPRSGSGPPGVGRPWAHP